MIVFVDLLGLGITLPVLPLFAQNQLQAVAWQITALTSLYFVCQFLASPVLGRLSDRVGRRPVLIASQAGTLVAQLLTGLAPGIRFLYLARSIDGLTGGNISVAQAYLSDITDERNRASGLGTVQAAFGLGFVFGPAFGSVLAAAYGPRVPFFCSAAVSLLTISLSFFLLPESLPPERRHAERLAAEAGGRMSSREVLRAPGMMLLLAVAFTSQFGFFAFQSVFVLWAEKLVFFNLPEAAGQQAIGAILTFVGLCAIGTQFWLVGPLVRRFGERKLVFSGNLSRAFSLGLMAAMPNVAASVIAQPFMAVGGGVSLPALIAVLTYAAPPGGRGQVIGLQQSAAAMGSIVGPLISGFLSESVHPNASMIFATAVMSVAVIVSANIFRLPTYTGGQAARSPAGVG
jgi:DHA1 family tetracycline resistance protein-like MFS transporter